MADQASLNSVQKRGVSPLRFLSLVRFACLAALCSFATLSSAQNTADVPQDPEAVWTTIPPSTAGNLVWIPCYTTLQCARLTVPLDYTKPDGAKAFVAMAKVPANVSASDAAYRGPVLFNPGGPGVSGIDLIRGAGQSFQTVLGEEYDIIGFDPRGVGRTLPPLNVFPDAAEGLRWRVQSDAVPLPNITQDAVARLRDQSIIYGQLAESRIADVAPYVTTALVCRDMLSIATAHGRDKVQYWGLSYGTVIGVTFASMFPDRIERMVLDGVLHAQNYYATLFSDNLLDADKVLDWFLRDCVAAGPEQCTFHSPSVPELKTRLLKLLDSLKASPLPVTTSPAPASPTEYGIVDYAFTMRAIFAFLTSPSPSIVNPVSAASLAAALLAAEQGDGVPLWNLYTFTLLQFEFDCDAKSPLGSITNDGLAAILCTDGDPVEDTAEELQALFDRMVEDSMFSVIWTQRARCAGWKIRPVERYSGPFVGNTSYPILFIGNTADPVAPLAHAHTMSEGFSGSVVLTQNSPGHCSISAQSVCTSQTVRAYFRDGKLPEPGTVCEVESRLFPEAELARRDKGRSGTVADGERIVIKAREEL